MTDLYANNPEPNQLKQILDAVVQGGICEVNRMKDREPTVFIVYHTPNRLVYGHGEWTDEVEIFLRDARSVDYHLTPECIWNN